MSNSIRTWLHPSRFWILSAFLVFLAGCDPSDPDDTGSEPSCDEPANCLAANCESDSDPVCVECEPGYVLDEAAGVCTEPVCDPSCANGGTCVDTDTCDCDGTGYEGPTCEDRTCDPACENGGTCTDAGVCDCDETGFGGASCEAPSTLFFSAIVEGSGRELWRTDGTEAGTELVADINPTEPVPFDTDGCLSDGNTTSDCEFYYPDDCEQDSDSHEYCGTDGGSSPGHFIAMGSYVYFTADDGQTGRELWRTDGEIVENLTDLNPNGSAFPDPDTGVDSDPSGLFAVHGDSLYFAAFSGEPLQGSYSFSYFIDGQRHLYRFSQQDGVEQVPLQNGSMELAGGSIAVFDDHIYAIFSRFSDRNADIVEYDGENPARSLGVPTEGAQGNTLSSLMAADEGLVFGGYTTSDSYRTYAYAPNSQDPEIADVGGSIRGETSFLGHVCGTDGDNGLVCYDGRALPEGLADVGPDSVDSMTSAAVVDGSRLCFRAYDGGYRLYCAEGLTTASPLPGSPDGGGLTAGEGTLYWVDGDSMIRYDFLSDTQSTIDEVVGGSFSGLTLHPALGFAAYPAYEVTVDSEQLRIYSLSDEGVTSVTLNTEASAAPRRFFAWTP